MGKFNEVNEKIGRYRWKICALVFFATTINYLDRNVLGLLKLELTETFSWSEADYSYVIMSFQIAYAVGLLGIGGIIDKIGTKKGYAYSLFGWSLAAIGHAFASSTFGFGVARAALGVTEAGNFPAANKAVAEWFPKKERALATGIYNSGSNIGAIVAPLTVPWIAFELGWQWAFALVGAVGLIWLIFWEVTYKPIEVKYKEGKVGKAEYEYIHSDKDEAEVETAEEKKIKVSWFKLLWYRQTWAFFFGKFFTDPVWWFFLFWLPAYLQERNTALLAEGNEAGVISWPFAVAVVYTISTFGSVLGGWLPKRLINKGMDSNKARKLSMFIYAVVPLSVLGVQSVGEINTWYAVLIIGLACAAHQAWSANIFATVSDMFPKKAIASVTGIGGMAGAAGGILIAWAAGLLLDHFKALDNITAGYNVMFIVCALAYLTAWVIMHLFVPKFKIIKDL